MSRKSKIVTVLLILLLIFLYPFHDAKPIRYMERESKQIKVEKVPGEFWLNWLYNNPVGELSLEAFVKRKALSEWYGNRMDSPESVDKIKGFISTYNINMDEAVKQDFNSFNDFFYRKLKAEVRPINPDSNVIVSPADGKILAYDDISNQDFIIKGYRFDLQAYLPDAQLYDIFKGGTLIIVRLCPTDYHRFHFPVSGTVAFGDIIDGDLYSVSPIALRKRAEIFCMNKREYVLLHNEYLRNVFISEVGATMVGSIIQTYRDNTVEKGEEKGYFKFGGSTVVLLFEKGKITVDADLLENTKNGLETSIHMGEQIATHQK